MVNNTHSCWYNAIDLLLLICNIVLAGLCFHEKGPNQFFFFKISNLGSLKCSLHIPSYALRSEVSVMELQGSEFLISRTFQLKRYISIARTGNFIMYALGPFSRKRSRFTEFVNVFMDMKSGVIEMSSWI